MSKRKQTLIAKFAAAEACDATEVGTILVVMTSVDGEATDYKVCVQAGILPDGDDEKHFTTAKDAIHFASECALMVIYDTVPEVEE
jgi:hypothetical protein